MEEALPTFMALYWTQEDGLQFVEVPFLLTFTVQKPRSE